jgi:regulatory protein
MDKVVMLNRMMRQCALREYCRSDIRRKLDGLPQAEADEILSKLCHEGYVDDARYARAFARDKSALQGWGSLKIKLALQRKAIDAAAIASALEAIDTPAAEARKEQVLRAKWNALDREDDPARRQAKFFRYAMSRGYGYEETKRIYDYLRRD